MVSKRGGHKIFLKYTEVSDTGKINYIQGYFQLLLKDASKIEVLSRKGNKITLPWHRVEKIKEFENE